MEVKLKAPRDKTLGVVEQVFKNRGILDAYKYLHTSKTDLHSPLLLDNIREGAIMLMRHIKADDIIFVQVDEDCDGYTSAALLINYLNRLFPYFTQHNVIYRTHRFKEHGICVEEIPPEVRLVIVPDAGSSEYDKHEALAEKGVDILILDHHNAEKPQPPHACLINNQTCNYPNKTLSGVGIVYKFCSYLDEILNQNIADDFLDLVAIGMIADMIKLNNYETRELVSKGLANVKNPFIEGMVLQNEFYLKGELTPHGVSFSIAPCVNAVARVGSFEERMLMLEAMLEFTAYEKIPSTKRGAKGQEETKVEQACRNCTNIRNRQNKDRDNTLRIAEEMVKEQDLLQNPILFIQFQDQEVNENLTGLIANQIANVYNRPTLILNDVRKVEFDEETGEVTGEKDLWQGSMRNIKGTRFSDFQKFLQDSNLIEWCQGHSNAAGVAILKDKIEELKVYCKQHLNESDFTPTYQVDLEIEAGNLNPADILTLGEMKHVWGDGVEEPLICVRNLPINASILDFLKGTTVKISPTNTDGLTYIMFKTDEKVYNSLYSEQGVVTIDLVGKCARNDWNGKPQIIIEDFEIVRRQQYYF